jgi:uncharacterized protein (TIGR00159 family)
MANGATRLQPLVLNVGQAAGLAAALAVRRGQPPAAVPVAAIQRGLIEDPQAPAGPLPLWDTPWHHPEWAQRQRQALADPAALSPEGRLRGRAGAGPASGAPPEPGERLWQGELRRLMELLGTGRLGVLFGDRKRDQLASGSVAVLSEAAGRLSQSRRGGLIVVDLGSDLRPEDFLNPGISLDAQLSVDLLLNLFAADTPLHDGAVLVKANRIVAAGVILPLSRQGLNRYGTRHLAALGLTERFDQCLAIVVSEETGTLSLASQGKLERPITSSRLHDLLNQALALPAGRSVAKDPLERRG